MPRCREEDKPPSRAARRRRAVQLGFGLLGLSGLTAMVVLIHDRPWAKQGLAILIGWQLLWYTLRALVMIGIWNREPELSNREKWWIGITVPIGILFAIWLGRGKLSQWIAAEEAREDEERDDGS